MQATQYIIVFNSLIASKLGQALSSFLIIWQLQQWWRGDLNPISPNKGE